MNVYAAAAGSTKRSTKLTLPPANAHYRRPLLRGRAVSVFYDWLCPIVLRDYSYDHLLVLLLPALAECEITVNENGQPRRLTLRGQQVCFIAPGLRHAVDWRRAGPLVMLFVEPQYLRDIGVEGVTGVTTADFQTLVGGDLATWSLAEIFRGLCRV